MMAEAELTFRDKVLIALMAVPVVVEYIVVIYLLFF